LARITRCGMRPARLSSAFPARTTGSEMTPIYGDRGRSETYGDATCMCCRRRSSTTPGCHVSCRPACRS
jgi:hypothetical protein